MAWSDGPPGAGDAALLPLPEGRFAGPAAFADVIRQALAHADREGWAEMVWSDASFEDWPLRERAVIDSLDAWACKGRKLTLLAQHFDAMPRHHPRFVAWRIRWDHLVECHASRAADASAWVSALWTPNWAMRRLDVPGAAGVASLEPRMRMELWQVLEEQKRRCTPGFAATTLGL